MPGIEVLSIIGLNENPRLNEMFSAYASTYGNDVEPYSRLSFYSPVEMVYSWIAETMGLKEHKEYFFFCGRAGLSYWTYGLQSPPCGCMIEIQEAS